VHGRLTEIDGAGVPTFLTKPFSTSNQFKNCLVGASGSPIFMERTLIIIATLKDSGNFCLYF
jgi:hypothetical protein